MTIAQEQLDDLWDFADPAGSEVRLRAAVAAADGGGEGDDGAGEGGDGDELRTQVARALGLQDRFDEADAELDAIGGTAPAVRARVLLERGRLRNSAGDPAAAVPLFRSAAGVAASPDLLFLRVDALHMLAIADAADAAAWTAEALALLEETDDPRTLRWRVGLHNNAGWALFDAGDHAGALTEFEAARAAALRWGTPQQIGWADEAIAEARAALGG